MLTDTPPRKKNRESFRISDRTKALELPRDGQLVRLAGSIESAMRNGAIGDVRVACAEFLGTASDFYNVPPCPIRVLTARPLRVQEYSTTELFGDYHPSTMLIRVWTRTAVRKEITSFGTFLSTLCHEFCHHLDLHHFGFRDSWHTRGFYERAGALYYHSRGTSAKKTILASGSGPALAYRLAAYEPNPEPLTASPLKRDSVSSSTVLVFPVPRLPLRDPFHCLRYTPFLGFWSLGRRNPLNILPPAARAEAFKRLRRELILFQRRTQFHRNPHVWFRRLRFPLDRLFSPAAFDELRRLAHVSKEQLVGGQIAQTRDSA